MSSLWAKIAAGGAILLGILLSVLKIFSAGKKSERNRIGAETGKTVLKVIKTEKKNAKETHDLSDADLDAELLKHSRKRDPE